MEGYHPQVAEGLRHISADALPPQMRESYAAVAPRPEDWTKLIAKVAEHARTFEGMPVDEVRAIAAPALVLVADRDIVRIDHAQELAPLLRASLEVLPNSDHVSYLLADPDVLLSRLTPFLETRG